MKIFNKNVRYLKFFEDIMLIEHDERNKRLAIVFNGKEAIINIFDSSPYVEYTPIVEAPESDFSVGNTSGNEDTSSQLNMTFGQDIDITKVFQQLQMSMGKTNKSPIGSHAPKIIKNNNQHCIIFGNPISEGSKRKSQNEYNLHLSVVKFSIEYKATKKNKKVSLSLIKPKIKNKILGVITSFSSTILKMKWFDNPLCDYNNTNDEITKAKLLLAICDDGTIQIFKLQLIKPNEKVKINEDQLQSQPFSNLIEQWKTVASTMQQVPIRDFYLLSSKDKGPYMKLFTLHVDNNIYFWYILFDSIKIKFSPTFCVSFDPSFSIENILIDRNETFLYCFNTKGIEIYHIGKEPPFNKVYHHLYEDYAMTSQIKFKEEELEPFSSCGIDTEVIDLNKNTYIEDIKFFKNTSGPCFICLEQKILVQIFNIYNSKYQLLFLDIAKLKQAIQVYTSFIKCVDGTDKTILKEVFESSDSFTYCVSPCLYYNLPDKNVIVSEKMELETNNIIDNIYQVLFIQNGDKNFFGGVCLGDSQNSLLGPKKNNNCNVNKLNEKLLQIFPINSDEHINCITFQKKSTYHSSLLWIQNNTIIISSQRHLFDMIKFCNESRSFGVPLNNEKVHQFLKI